MTTAGDETEEEFSLEEGEDANVTLVLSAPDEEGGEDEMGGVPSLLPHTDSDRSVKPELPLRCRNLQGPNTNHVVDYCTV